MPWFLRLGTDGLVLGRFTDLTGCVLNTSWDLTWPSAFGVEVIDGGWFDSLWSLILLSTGSFFVRFL